MLQANVETQLNTFHLRVQLTAQAGETLVLLGESGSGKSTMLRLLAGLLMPDRGHIELDDICYFDSEKRIAQPPQERSIGLVFQDYVLFPHLSIFENVAFGLRAQHLSRSLVRKRVEEALEQVHLSGLEQRKPAQISGGQQQRVAIARALALQPQLLLLDEPMAALDVQTRREVRQELRQILRDANVVTVFVTHQYLEALLFGQQILVLDQGQVIQQGTQRDLLEYPRSSYIAELVGMNFFQGRISGYEAERTCIIQLAPNSQTLEVVATLKEQESAEPRPSLGTEAYVIVDPRNVTLHQTPPDSSARNLFQGNVVQILRVSSASHSTASEGGRLRVSLLISGHTTPLTAEISETSASRLQLHEGQHIFATFKASEASAYS
ncbi:MAG TPA: ATP-binding cassette domain-containing protein [Ktedonobacteraceae bacterium]|jgi:molybdate transport system ATP-binding protein